MLLTLIIFMVFMSFLIIGIAWLGTRYRKRAEIEKDVPIKQAENNHKPKGSLLVTLFFLDNPLIWALFPSARRSIRDYLNRD